MENEAGLIFLLVFLANLPIYQTMIFAKRKVLLILILVLIGPSLGLAAKNKRLNFTALDKSLTLSPAVYIEQESLKLDPNLSQEIILKLDSSSLLNNIRKSDSFSIAVYENFESTRDYLGTQSFKVPKTKIPNFILKLDIGEFKASTKKLELDFYDVDESFVDTYKVTITAENFNNPVTVTTDPGVVCGASFGECQLDYFFSKAKFELASQRLWGPKVTKSASGDYVVSLPFVKTARPRNGFKTGKKGKKNKNDDGATSASTGDFFANATFENSRFIGDLFIEGGQDGYVLTSDANGQASWQEMQQVINVNAGGGSTVISSPSGEQVLVVSNDNEVSIGENVTNSKLNVTSNDGKGLIAAIDDPIYYNSIVSAINEEDIYRGLEVFRSQPGYKLSGGFNGYVLSAATIRARPKELPTWDTHPSFKVQGINLGSRVDDQVSNGTAFSHVEGLHMSYGIDETAFSANTYNTIYGIKLIPNVKSYGTVNNWYDLYITNQASITANVTNRWTIYSAPDAPAYFKGGIAINTTSPSSDLHVNADALFSNGSLATDQLVIRDSNSVQSLNTGDSIASTYSSVKVVGNAGPVTLTSNPQIAAGSDGQVIIIKGTDDVNTVTLVDGSGLSLIGDASFALGNKDTIMLMYDSDDSEWTELFRGDK